MSKLEFESFKTGAILRAYYLDYYVKMEDRVKQIFSLEVIIIEGTLKKKLYFYHGFMHKSKEFLKIDESKIIKEEKSYSGEESFKEFSLNHIIRLLKQNNEIESLNFNIASLAKSTVEISFINEIAIKLIEMRNKMAHTSSKLVKYEIESLSHEKIKEYNTFNLDDYNIENLDESNRSILTNLIYMKLVLDKLNSYDA